LERDALLEPAVRAAAADGVDQSWDLSDAVVTGKSDGIAIGVAALRGVGPGTAIVTLRQIDVGYCVTGVWFYSFGGAGATFKLAAQGRARYGDATLMTYAVTEGWQAAGVTSWLCKLITVRVDARGLLKIHETPGVDCPTKPPSVRIERKKDDILLREGSKSWSIDE
jgi:hypothetical protein